MQQLQADHYKQPPWSTAFPDLDVTTTPLCAPVLNVVRDNRYCTPPPEPPAKPAPPPAPCAHCPAGRFVYGERAYGSWCCSVPVPPGASGCGSKDICCLTPGTIKKSPYGNHGCEGIARCGNNPTNKTACKPVPQQIFTDYGALPAARSGWHNTFANNTNFSCPHGVLKTDDSARAEASKGPVPDCGPPPAPLNSSVPNVLLIGDSISMGTGNDTYPDGGFIPLGYGWDVQASLEPVGLAQVQHNGGWYLAGQAGASKHGIECIDHWLGSGGWDVVHVNFGLHDIDASEFVPSENYTRNLDYMYCRIEAKLAEHGQMIWGSTSPVPYPSEYKV